MGMRDFLGVQAPTFKPDDTSRVESPGINEELVGRTRDITSSLSSRLQSMREARPENLKTAMQPGLQNIAEQEAVQKRELSRGLQGSRSLTQMGELDAGADFARMELSAGELGNLLNQEGGLQQLESGFIGMFNQMGQEAFSREMQGLGAAANQYLTKQGAEMNIQKLQADSARASSEMAGRFISSIGMEMNRGTTPNYDSGSVTSMPSIFNS